MKSLIIKACLLFIGVGFNGLYGQIRFPKGNVLDLKTTEELIYLETRILFNTGIYKASDYHWEKISQNLKSDWFITACFNGDCRNDLLQSGHFIKDYGLNDTTCFIAFHVETFGKTGTSEIQYRVYNSLNLKDSADLIFHIEYSNPAKIKKEELLELRIPNPVGKSVTVFNVTSSLMDIQITNSLGELVYQSACIQPMNGQAEIPCPELKNGFYYFRSIYQGKVISRKIQILN